MEDDAEKEVEPRRRRARSIVSDRISRNDGGDYGAKSVSDSSVDGSDAFVATALHRKHDVGVGRRRQTSRHHQSDRQPLVSRDCRARQSRRIHGIKCGRRQY